MSFILSDISDSLTTLLADSNCLLLPWTKRKLNNYDATKNCHTCKVIAMCEKRVSRVILRMSFRRADTENS